MAFLVDCFIGTFIEVAQLCLEYAAHAETENSLTASRSWPGVLMGGQPRTDGRSRDPAVAALETTATPDPIHRADPAGKGSGDNQGGNLLMFKNTSSRSGRLLRAAMHVTPPPPDSQPPDRRRRPGMTRGLPLPRPSRFLLLAAALVALAVLVVGDGAPPAQAQSATVLVSNMGQTARSSSFSTSNIVWAVRFDTGSNSAGYTLTSVEVVIGASPTESQRDTIRAELWSDNSGPDSKVYDLTVPAHPISAGTVTFTAPANATLSPDTVYWVVPYTTGSFNLMMGNTDSDGEDSGAAPGWSIGNASRFRQSNSPTGGSWGSQTLNTPVLKVQVNGPAADPLALSALTAESSTDGSNFAALTLEPEFHADDTEYWAAVTNDVTHVRLTPTLADTNSSVKVGKPGNLATVASGSASGAIALEAGVNEIRAAVTDADGFTRPYYVYVSRAASDQLASNIGQVSFGGYDTDGYVYAPGFTTGSNTGGYTLTSIEAYLLSDPSAAESGKFRAELWSAATGGGPDSKLYDLTVPSDMAAGVVSFAAPANTTLAASTTYHAVFYTTDNTAIELDDTDTTDDDPGGATGWSIGNTGYNQEREEPDATETWDTSDYSLGLIKIAVKGTEALSPLDLSDLTAESSTDGSNFTALTLNPDFAADTTEYRAAVANDVTHVRLTPTLANTNSSVKVGKSGGTLTTVSSGSASGAIPVDVGANEITVEVTDTNSNTQNYIVTVYRTASDLLVTNLGQEVFTRDRLALTPVAQGFTTGSHAGGYSLRSINATFEVVGTVSAADAAKVRAELWSAVASGSEAGQPDEKLIDLTPPTSISAGVLTFTPPSNAGLGPNTTFLLLLYLSSDLATGVEIRWTATDQSSEDLGQTGWSVADEVFSAFDIVNVGRLWTGQANVQHVSVNGAEADPVALTALTLETSADGSTFTAVTGAEALAPAFDAATAGYRATVGNDVTHVRLTATEAGGGRVGIGTDTLQLCDSGTPCDPIPLQVGDTNISVGAIGIGTLDYTVIVRRVPAGSEWWATLTPVAGTNNVGCNDVTECGSALTDNVFTLGGTDFYLGWITDNDSNSVTGPNALEIGLVDSTGGAARAPNDALKALNFCVGPGRVRADDSLRCEQLRVGQRQPPLDRGRAGLPEHRDLLRDRWRRRRPGPRRPGPRLQRRQRPHHRHRLGGGPGLRRGPAGRRQDRRRRLQLQRLRPGLRRGPLHLRRRAGPHLRQRRHGRHRLRRLPQ